MSKVDNHSIYPQIHVNLKEGQQIYFASDFHLLAPSHETSVERERKIVNWLKSIKNNAAAIFLVGDLFDFWFEYKHTVPKGAIRFLGCLAELVDEDIPLYVFSGNHDIWMFDYLEKELGIQILREPRVIVANQKKIFVAHGDGLGPGDTKFKILKKIFTNPICQWLFRWVHPDIGIKIALAWSRRSRANHAYDDLKGTEQEFLVKYARRKLTQAHYDGFVFGHRHIPIELQLNENSKYVNLGDWLMNYTYGTFDGQELKLMSQFNE